jgi:hypothetical protein
MRRFFAYIRVSTAKQGEQGVSLQEQRGAIERYASRNGIEIIQWFEERETAVKRGRPIFSQMLKLIRQGKGDVLSSTRSIGVRETSETGPTWVNLSTKESRSSLQTKASI